MNYYEILEVSSTATPKQIKDAYRKLVKKFHPDVYKGAGDPSEKIQKINEAYSTLSDPTKKLGYDDSLRGRSNGGYGFDDFIKNNRQRNTQRPQYNQNTYNGRNQRSQWEDFVKNSSRGFETFSEEDDFIKNHYNGGEWDKTNNQNVNNFIKTQPSNLQIKLSVGIQDILDNKIKNISYNRKVICDCLLNNSFKSCTKCNNVGFVQVPNNIKIRIPKDSYIGSTILYKGFGNQGSNQEFGDLLISIVDIKGNQDFKFDDDHNIIQNYNISIMDSIIGTNIEVKTVLGKEDYKLGYKEVFDKDMKLPFINKGIVKDKDGNRTNHIVKFKIEITDDLINYLKDYKIPNKKG
jgi:molecular chaperone DnaJ